MEITLVKFRKRDGEIRYKYKYDKERIMFEHIVGKNKSSYSGSIGKRVHELFLIHGIYTNFEVDKHTMEKYKPHVGVNPS
jgi:hypothetical protein